MATIMSCDCGYVGWPTDQTESRPALTGGVTRAVADAFAALTATLGRAGEPVEAPPAHSCGVHGRYSTIFATLSASRTPSSAAADIERGVAHVVGPRSTIWDAQSTQRATMT